MKLTLLRHATLLLEYPGELLLVDPMLSPAGAMHPVANAGNDRRIPLVDLPMDDTVLRDLVRRVDAVLVTHNHRDHWDAYAREILPRETPVLCQAGDESAIRESGFARTIPIADVVTFGKITLHRTGGRHGTGDLGKRMGSVSGFALRAPGEPRLYIAGDTIWCDEVSDALERHQPDYIVVNAGEARYTTGDPITMSAADVASVARARPQARVIAVHMETVNHCGLTRAMLADYLKAQGLESRVIIPADGETLELS